MSRKLISLATCVVVFGLAGGASAVDLHVPVGTTHTVTGTESYGMIDVAGTLIIESTGSLTATERSLLNGPNATIIVNGGSILLDAWRSDIGQHSDGYIYVNDGGTFTVTGFLTFPDNPGGKHRIYLNDGIMDVGGGINFQGDRDAIMYVGDGILRLGSMEEGDPAVWQAQGWLLPAEAGDEIFVAYVAPESIEVTAVVFDPERASNPSPQYGAEDIALDADFGWQGPAGATYDVYVGTDPWNLVQVATGQSATSYDPGPLGAVTTYYWRVNSIVGVETHEGHVWRFTTMPRTWTNADPADDSWCTPGNWAGGAVPGPTEIAFIIPPPYRGPIIDCDVDVYRVRGPGWDSENDQVVDITGGAIVVDDAWRWGGFGTATINISGSPSITIEGTGSDWRGADDGTSILNISGNPTISVADSFRGADSCGSFFQVNMSGGHLSAGAVKLGDDGVSELNLSGGTIDVDNNMALGGSRGSAGTTVNMTGGSIIVGGTLWAPPGSGAIVCPGEVIINLAAGTIECGSFSHTEENWSLDIEEGALIIAGDVTAEIAADIIAGHITAFGGQGIVNVNLIDGNTWVTAGRPIADAGPDQKAAVGSTVSFDGSSSYDPDGTIVSYSWDFDDDTTYTETTTNYPDGAFDGITTHAYTAAGIYVVTLTVTDDDDFMGSDTCTITVGPDLSVTASDISFAVAYRAQNINVTISAMIHNVGGEDASSIIVRLYDGDPQAGGTQIGGDKAIDLIQPGGTQTVTVRWMNPPAGAHNVYVVVDPDNNIPEADEANNKAYNAMKASPDLALTAEDISIDPLYSMVDQTVTIAATIHNDGLIVADSFVVRFYDGDPAAGGTQIGADQTVSSLLGGDSATVSVQPTFSTVGKRHIYVVADADNQVEELSETNNEAFILLYVQYPTIQETINAAPQHGTIYIGPGTYYENVLVDKPVTIVGAGSDVTIIDAGGAEATAHITADSVEFSGFTVKNNNGQYGIYVDQAAGVSLDNLVVDDPPGWGVVFNGVSGFSVTDSTFANNTQGGIKVLNSDNGVIDNCVIQNNGHYGIRIQNSSYVTITNCLIQDNADYAIRIQNSNNISVGDPANGNTITGTHKYGIYNQESDYTTIVYNEVNGYSDTGIWDIGTNEPNLNLNSYSVIRNNTIDGGINGRRVGQYGIQTQWVDTDRIVHNTIKYNDAWGAKSWWLSTLYNCFNYNTYIGNRGGFWYDPPAGTETIPYVFDGNVFINNTVAIKISGASSLFTTSNNTITGSQIAIYCESGSPTIEDNDMSDNAVGIYIESGTPTITGNTVTENAIGVYISEVSDPIMYDNEIYANTADTTTTPPILTIDALIDVVESMELEAGIESSLILKLNAANEALLRGQISAAINQLTAFINEVEAQRDDHITDSQADELIAAATTTAHGLSYLLRNSIGA